MIIGEQLGAGQFGVVYRAEQTGTVNDPEDTRSRTVVVKMIKSTLEPHVLKSLMSDLNSLMHLGRHLNLVNFLGACTKGKYTYICIIAVLITPHDNFIEIGEILVIEEFCNYGNIRDYLNNNRDAFINEMKNSDEAREFQEDNIKYI